MRCGRAGLVVAAGCKQLGAHRSRVQDIRTWRVRMLVIFDKKEPKFLTLTCTLKTRKCQSHVVCHVWHQSVANAHGAHHTCFNVVNKFLANLFADVHVVCCVCACVYALKWIVVCVCRVDPSCHVIVHGHTICPDIRPTQPQSTIAKFKDIRI